MGVCESRSQINVLCVCTSSSLQMLKHGRAGVPMEVMGLMLGEFVDDYTVRVIDVFAMPQSGTVSSSLCWLFLFFFKFKMTFVSLCFFFAVENSNHKTNSMSFILC